MSALAKTIKPPKFWEITKELNFVPEVIGYLFNCNKKYDCEYGDDHIVRVIPGLGAGDYSTLLLRNFLKKRGFDARGWGLGMNRGNHKDLETQLNQMIYDDYLEKEKAISLIGHSLGGICAILAGRNNPDMVRSIITLDSPFNFGAQGVNVIVKFLYRILSGHWAEDIHPSIIKKMRMSLPMPFTAIASKASGVVTVETATKKNVGRLAENIVLDNVSHCGMIVNEYVFQILANRLSQPENVRLWKKYLPPTVTKYKPRFSKSKPVSLPIN